MILLDHLTKLRFTQDYTCLLIISYNLQSAYFRETCPLQKMNMNGKLVKHSMKKLVNFKILSVVAHKATCVRSILLKTSGLELAHNNKYSQELSESFTFLFLFFFCLILSIYIFFTFFTSTPSIRLLGILIFQFSDINKINLHCLFSPAKVPIFSFYYL